MKVIFKKAITGHEILISDEAVSIAELKVGNIVSCNHYPYKPVEIMKMLNKGVVTRWGGENTSGRFESFKKFLEHQYHKWFYHDVDTDEIIPAAYAKINATTYGE